MEPENPITPPQFQPPAHSPYPQQGASNLNNPQFASAEEEFLATFGLKQKNHVKPALWSSKTLASLLVLWLLVFWASATLGRFFGSRINDEETVVALVICVYMISTGILAGLKIHVGWAMMMVGHTTFILVFLGPVFNALGKFFDGYSSKLERLVGYKEFPWLLAFTLIGIASVAICMMPSVRSHYKVPKALYIVIVSLCGLAALITIVGTFLEGFF